MGLEEERALLENAVLPPYLLFIILLRLWGALGTSRGKLLVHQEKIKVARTMITQHDTNLRLIFT